MAGKAVASRELDCYTTKHRYAGTEKRAFLLTNSCQARLTDSRTKETRLYKATLDRFECDLSRTPDPVSIRMAFKENVKRRGISTSPRKSLRCECRQKPWQNCHRTIDTGTNTKTFTIAQSNRLEKRWRSKTRRYTTGLAKYFRPCVVLATITTPTGSYAVILLQI